MIHVPTNTRPVPIPTKPRGTTPPVQPVIRKPIEHGTLDGYRRHLELGGGMCVKCAQAVTASEKPSPRRIATRPEIDIRAAAAAYTEGMSLAVVARDHHIERNRLRDLLAEAGVEIRRPGGAHPGRARKSPQPKKPRVYVPPFDIAEARRLYVDERMPYDAVAQALGVKTGKTIRLHLSRAGVKSRTRGETQAGKTKPIKSLPIEELVKAYTTGATLAELAKEHDVMPDTVRSRLVGAGVKIRGKGMEGRRAANAIPREVEDEIVRLLEAGVPTRQAAILTGRSRSTVFDVANRRGVELRPAAEARWSA